MASLNSQCQFHDSMLGELQHVIQQVYCNLVAIDNQINQCFPVVPPPPGFYTPGNIYSTATPDSLPPSSVLFENQPAQSPAKMDTINASITHLQSLVSYLSYKLTSINNQTGQHSTPYFQPSTNGNYANANQHCYSTPAYPHQQQGTVSFKPWNHFTHNSAVAIVSCDCTCSAEVTKSLYWFCNNVCGKLRQIQNQSEILQQVLATAITKAEINLITLISKLQEAKTVIGTTFDSVSNLGQQAVNICSNLQINTASNCDHSYSSKKQASNMSTHTLPETFTLFPAVKGQLDFSFQNSPIPSSSSQLPPTMTSNGPNDQTKPKGKFKKTASAFLRKLLPKSKIKAVTPATQSIPDYVNTSNQFANTTYLDAALSIINIQSVQLICSSLSSSSFLSVESSPATQLSSDASCQQSQSACSFDQSSSTSGCRSPKSIDQQKVNHSQQPSDDELFRTSFPSTNNRTSTNDPNSSAEFHHVLSTCPEITTPTCGQTAATGTQTISENPLVMAFRLPNYTGASDFTPSSVAVSPTPVKSVRALINEIETRFLSSSAPTISNQPASKKAVKPKFYTPSQLPIPGSPTAKSSTDVTNQPEPDGSSASKSSVSFLPSQLPSIPLSAPELSNTVQSPPPTANNTRKLSDQPSTTKSATVHLPHGAILTTTSPKLSTVPAEVPSQSKFQSVGAVDRLLCTESPLSSSDVTDSSLQTSSILKELELTELHSILQDSFISMTSLLYDDQTEEQKEDELLTILNQTMNNSLEVGSINDDLDSNMFRSLHRFTDADDDIFNMSTVLYETSASPSSVNTVQTTKPDSQNPKKGSKSSMVLLDVQQEQKEISPPAASHLDQHQPNASISQSDDKVISAVSVNEVIQPEISITQEIATKPESDTVSLETSCTTPDQPSHLTSPYQTRQSTRKRLFKATSVSESKNVTLDDIVPLPDQPSANKRRKSCSSCDHPVSDNMVTSTVDLLYGNPRNVAAKANFNSPSKLASYISEDFSGKKITNSFPAKNSRSNLQKFMKIYPVALSKTVGKQKLADLLKQADDIQYEYNNYYNQDCRQIQNLDPMTLEPFPHLFARDLIWRLFTIADLVSCLQEKDVMLDVLDQDVLLAIKTTTYETFSVQDPVWQKKCVPQIARSIRNLFFRKLRSPVFSLMLKNQLVKK